MNCSETLLRIVRNSIFCKNPTSSSICGGETTSSSIEKSNSIEQSSSTNCFETRICSSKLIKVSRRFGCFISCALFRRFSNDPYTLINSAAVFTPIPGAPGTLSTLSPANACTSTTSSGFTPNFSITASRFIRRFFIASNISTPSPTSCIKSLSELMIVTRPPASRALQASVAMISSASKPTTSLHEMLNAFVASRVKGNCGTRSSGAGGLLAL